MEYKLVHFITYHRVYLFIGAALLLLAVLPTKGKISAGSRKALYLVLIIWLISFAYKISTGHDIVHLFHRGNDEFGTSRQPARVKGGPFNKYYSNDAGRKPKN